MLPDNAPPDLLSPYIGDVVYVVGTCDTKDAELRFACAEARRVGAKALLVDISTSGAPSSAEVTPDVVASFHPAGPAALRSATSRGEAVAAMAAALRHFLLSRHDIGAVLGLGGSGNTAMVAEAMRALPVGTPKLILSTVASGDVAGYIGATDIAMMYSVADIAGLNRITRQVIANAAHAAAGMALQRLPADAADLPTVGLTMFGVTTAAVTHIRDGLAGRFEPVVFHATGTGGRSMEKLAESGLLDALIDLTTTEVADHLVGGIMACTPDRFGAPIRARLPYLGSVGAVDMVNFGALASVPEKFRDRRLHVHNAEITLMRTTADETRAIGRFIVERVNRMQGPVAFLLPLRGVSAIDRIGEAFYDPEADAALFDAIRAGWQAAPNRRLVEIDAHINDPAFAAEVLDAFNDLWERREGRG